MQQLIDRHSSMLDAHASHFLSSSHSLNTGTPHPELLALPPAISFTTLATDVIRLIETRFLAFPFPQRSARAFLAFVQIPASTETSTNGRTPGSFVTYERRKTSRELRPFFREEPQGQPGSSDIEEAAVPPNASRYRASMSPTTPSQHIHNRHCCN